MYIKEHVAELWPSECSHKDYSGLNELACLICSPDQPKYTDTEKKIVRVCKSLIDKIYG